MQNTEELNNQTPLSPESEHSTDSLDIYSESTENGKKTYSCLAPNCGKIFKFKSEIKRHIIIHAKERPFECSYPGCKKTFKRADALGNHTKLHEKPCPYDCPIAGCKVQLNTKAGLQYHLSKHTEEEEIFRCNFPGCNQTFLTYKHLSLHERSTHYANANNISPVLTMKRPAQMMMPGLDNGLEALLYTNKKLAVQSYLAANPVKYEEDSYSMNTSSDSGTVKAEFQEEVSRVQVKPTLVRQPSSTMDFDENMKNALLSTLAENQRLKKEFMLSMNFLQNNMLKNNQVRNQTYITSAYKSLMEPLYH